ncbi:autotransporter outer membrane beta-barrel domain-containing protein [Bartonella schoenbuchensis]|uniref:autotransporter outer membrane beta-barrel domain-containing protein n=1 Tax=Bartonella schoenbuchensis TaxID=165694 RepID=UPI00099A5FB2|nr:autotransporter outer membrane beta-barrel domain-containing protein [Bartonella schoenbuchensis]
MVVEGNNQGTGLYMTQGAVRLTGTTLRDVAKGMTISKGIVHMVGGSVTFSGRYGISVSGGNAFLSGFKITRQENKGTVAVAVEDTVANTVEDTVEGVGAGAGVEVSHSAKVMMKGVNIEGVKTGAYVMGNGFLVMGKGSISFKGDYGIYFDQGYAVLNDVHITGSGHKGTGIKMGYGQLLMVDTTLKEVAEGMTIVKGNVSMVGGSIEFEREHGVLLKQGSVLLNNLSMKYRGSNSDATFLKVEADSVVDKEGKRVLNTADIKGIGIKIDGQDKARGVYVNNGGRVMLKSAIFSDVLNGVMVANAQFRMEDGKINFHGDYAVNLATGNVLLKGVIVEYKGDNKLLKDVDIPDFIKVKGKGASFTAIKTVISGDRWGRGRGLHVTKGGHATLNQSHFTKVQSAITVKEGSVWMGNGSIKFNGEHGVLLYEGKVILEKVLMSYEGNKSADFIKAEGRESVIRVIDTIINGNDKGKGAHITKGGHVRLINSNLNKLDTGITAENAEITMSNTSMSFKGSHGVSLSVGKAILNKVNMTHTGNNDTDFLKAQGKGANLDANKVIIKGSKNKGKGLHVTQGAKTTLLQSELTGIAKGIHIDSGIVNVRRSTITVEGTESDESYGISLWGSQKSTETHLKRSRRSTSNNLTTAHHIPKISEVGVVNLTLTTLKVPNSIAIHGKTAKSFITLKDSNISGDLLLEAKNGSAIMLATNNSSLTGGSQVDNNSNALFYLTNKSKWFLTKRKNQDFKKPSSLISGIMLKDSAIIFEKPTSDVYQTLNIGKGYHSIYLAQGDAQLHLNIQVGQDGSLDDDKTDRVLIYGSTAGGTTKIHMSASSNGIRGSGQGTVSSKANRNNNKQSVSIVQVSGAAKKDSFQLNHGYVTLGNSPYQYHLVAYGPGSELKADPQKRLVKGDGDFWDFRLEGKNIPFDPRHTDIVPIKPAIVPQVPTYLLLPNALFYAGLIDINNQTELLGTMVTSFDPFFNGKPAFFVRGYGGSHTYTSDLSALEYGYGAKFDYRAADAAVLLSTLESEQNSAFIGAIGTYSKLSLQPQDVEKSKKSNFDQWSVTAYASLQHNMGFYINGLLSYGLSRGDVETLARGKTARITGKPLRAALTGGKAFLTGHEGLVFEPQMQLIYQYLMFNSTRDVDGFNINMGSPSQLTTRLGGRLAQEFALMEEDSSVSFYGKLHLMGNFGGKQFVQFKDTFQLGAFGSSMEAGVGVQAQLSSQIALHGDVVYQQKLTKAGFSGSTFSGGLRYRF